MDKIHKLSEKIPELKRHHAKALTMSYNFWQALTSNYAERKAFCNQEAETSENMDILLAKVREMVSAVQRSHTIQQIFSSCRILGYFFQYSNWTKI